MAGQRRTLMGWTVATSLRFRYLVAALGVLVMAVGIVVLPSSRLDVFPEFAPPRVVVQTVCLGLSTADVEELVTVPLEQALNGVEGLDDLRSKSVPQLSSDRADLRPGHRPARGPSARPGADDGGQRDAADVGGAAGDARAGLGHRAGRCKIGMTSDDQSLIQMSMTAYWTIRARLLAGARRGERGHLGRAAADAAGAGRPDAMAQHDITLNQVMETTAEAVDSGLLQFDDGLDHRHRRHRRDARTSG